MHRQDCLNVLTALTLLYPLIPARPILPHLILAYCSSSFTCFSPQFFSYFTIFFHSPHSGQYLDLSIRYQSPCAAWSSVILQPPSIFVYSFTGSIPSLNSRIVVPSSTLLIAISTSCIHFEEFPFCQFLISSFKQIFAQRSSLILRMVTR